MDDVRARGRCLCGGVTFRVTGTLRDVIDCHCHRCRRFTGHHLAATSAPVEDLALDDPDGLLAWFEPAAGAAYGFCSRCGSSLFWRSTERPGEISISAGTLDPPTGLRTVEAWWVDEASDYHERPHLPERRRE